MTNIGSIQPPGGQQSPPNLPGGFELIVFEGYDTLNTKPTRPAIGDREMFICDNFMPIGPSNLRTLYDIGAKIYAAASGNTISYFNFGNISDTSLSVIFTSDGGITQVNTGTMASGTIAVPGTIVDPTQQIGFAQWGSQYLLFSAPQANGYFMWDGTLFYQAGSVSPTVNISNNGLHYSSPPIIQAVGGHGSGAAYTSIVSSGGSINQITVTATGSGYAATDGPLYLAFSGGGSGAAASAIATAVLNSTNGVGAITVVVGGSGYSPASVKVTLVGGGGFGATATTTISGGSGGSVSTVTVSAPGQAYTSPPTVQFTDTNNPVAQATSTLMPFGIQGTSIETFTGRVWITNGAAPTTPPQKSLTFFSAPGNPADFSIGDGAGSFLATDSFLRVGYHGLRQSNGFLYLVGDSSVNYISGVTTAGSPLITTFSNQNVDPQIGTPWPNTLQVFSRAIVFANTYGIFSMYGGAVQKVSGPLDGIYTTVIPSGSPPAFSGLLPSGAVATVFGIPLYLMLMPILDQQSGNPRNALLLWDGKRWFTAGPSVTMTQIASQEINSVLTAFGTDGTAIYPLFQTPSRAIAKTVQSKWFSKPTYVMAKKAQYVAGLIKSLGSQNAVLTVTVDSESANQAITFTDTSVITWLNNSGTIVAWSTASGSPVTWINPSTGVFVLPADVSGSLIGMTASTTTPDMVLNSLSVAAQQYSLLI